MKTLNENQIRRLIREVLSSQSHYDALYHGTSELRATEILKHGFDESRAGEKSNHGKIGISTSISEQEALEHAEWAAEKFDDVPCVLVCYNVSGLNLASGKEFNRLCDELGSSKIAISQVKSDGFDGVELFDLETEEGLEELEVLLFNANSLKWMKA